MKGYQLIGQRFGRLTVAARMPSDKKKRIVWRCTCDCGSEVYAPSSHLVKGKTKSCGCYKRSLLAVSNLQHGWSGTDTHNIWRGILKRCLTKTCAAYKDYGGRGIKVCDRWLKFENFLEDMGPRPSSNHSIERSDVDGDYEPSNCLWIPQADQPLNTRRTLRITMNGETKPLATWCREYGLRYGFVYDRIAVLGWPAERAFTEPSSF